MADPVKLYPGATDRVQGAGVPIAAIYAGALGGFITNPSTPAGQGIPAVEVLYYCLTGDAESQETGTTFTLQPGQTLMLPPGLTRDVSVNAVTAGHRFSAIMWHDPILYPPEPVPGTFPPDGPTSLLSAIPSYLYVQYNDDSDLQAFVRAYNEMQQEYVSWWNTIALPVYTGPLIVGKLLDWVAEGLYGMKRPTLSSGNNADIGPYNTAIYSEFIPFNEIFATGSSDVTVTTDDIFKRIMTWNLYRGDGRTFNLTWLKRRIVRFLNGPNGTDPGIQQTYSVSCEYASRTQVDIVLPSDPNATILKEAIESGAVSLPFQLSFSVTIAP